MSPEYPYLAAGTVAIIGGAIREQGWPPNVLKSVIGTIGLTIAASTTANSRFAPAVHALGLLLLLASVMAAVRAASEAHKGK